MLPQPAAGTTLLEFYRQLVTSCPIVDGLAMEVSFAVADGTLKIFRHGLGRPWRGLIITANSQATTIDAKPGYPGPLSFQQFGIVISAAADVTLRVWLF